MKKLILNDSPQRMMEAKAAGIEFVKNFVENPAEFDGQSEAIDLAAATGLDADYIYEGMLEEIKRQS